MERVHGASVTQDTVVKVVFLGTTSAYLLSGFRPVSDIIAEIGFACRLDRYLESRNYFHGANSLGAHALVPRGKDRVNSSLNAGCQEKRNNGYQKIGQMQTEVEVHVALHGKLSTHPHFPGVTKIFAADFIKGNVNWLALLTEP
jgi:hypothetical protein